MVARVRAERLANEEAERAARIAAAKMTYVSGPLKICIH